MAKASKAALRDCRLARAMVAGGNVWAAHATLAGAVRAAMGAADRDAARGVAAELGIALGDSDCPLPPQEY